jgi:integrase/recombinase XerD
MSSVHKRPGSPYWHGAFTDESGRRRFRCTKEKERNAALVVAERWQRQANELASTPVDVVKLRNTSEFLERVITLTQKAKAGVLTIADGQTLVAELLVATGGEASEPDSIRDFLNGFIVEKTKARANGTALRYKRIVEDFIKFLGKRAELPMASATPADLQKFRDQELKRGVSNASANMAIKVLRVPFNRARRLGLIQNNPAEAIDLMGHESAERRAFSLIELRALLNAANDEWKGMILLGYYCGFRIQDSATLLWSEVDFNRHVIVKRPGKERRDQKIHKRETIMLDELRQWLGARRGIGATPVFPSLHGKKSGGAFGLSLTFRALMEKAGIKSLNVAAKGSAKKFFDLGYHALRHSHISHAANAGVSEELRRKHVGHSSDVHDRYTHLDVGSFEKAFAEMPRILGP